MPTADTIALVTKTYHIRIKESIMRSQFLYIAVSCSQFLISSIISPDLNLITAC